MTKKELQKCLEGVPDEAIVFVEADHGQSAEMAYNVDFGMFPDGVEKEKCDPEDIKWVNNSKLISIAEAVLVSA